ncbi:hypothetical protein ACQEVG_04575 [Streptomyces sp. CA-135486]|uniref:hypothetical protein n=1 Tax=Streptomyces sp. CA-135486 TaxID=3240049 RepID=UPI003D9315A4
MRRRNALARNALAVGVTAATIAPAALTGPAATAATVTARAAADTIARPAAAPANAKTAPAAGPATAAPAPDAAASGSTAPTPLPPPPGNRQPVCGRAASSDFPIDTRIHGGPTVHRPGGGYEEWSVDLANTTGEICRNIYPVIVLTGRDPGLTQPRITLEFYDTQADRWRPATVETTAEDEVVGVLDDSGGHGRDGRSGGIGRFPGFVVPARASVTVTVRLALAADTPPNQVTVNAAIVQRHGDDGDWIGESGDYRFAVLDDEGPGATVTLEELATTGTGSLLRLGVAFGAVLLGGAALLLASRRLRTGRR